MLGKVRLRGQSPGTMLGGLAMSWAAVAAVPRPRATVQTVRRNTRNALNGVADRTARRVRRRRKLDAALAGGLPAVLEEPLRFYATRRLRDRPAVDRIEHRRADLAARTETAPNAMGRAMPINAYATRASVRPEKGMLLHLFARATAARTILELGSCVGIGGSYLASAGCERFIGVEGSPQLACMARDTVRTVKPDAEVHIGLFDDVLPELLSTIPEGIDLAWIDGHHEKEPTLRYFETLKPHLNAEALVLFDDTSWSAEMAETWQVLAHAEDFSHTVDLGGIGLGVWGGGSVSPRVWNMR